MEHFGTVLRSSDGYTHDMQLMHPVRASARLRDSARMIPTSTAAAIRSQEDVSEMACMRKDLSDEATLVRLVEIKTEFKFQVLDSSLRGSRRETSRDVAPVDGTRQSVLRQKKVDPCYAPQQKASNSSQEPMQ